MDMLKPSEIPEHIKNIYKKNPFMSDYFHVEIEDVKCGSAIVSLKTDPAKHTNHRGIIHGGVMAALADSVLGVTGASMGCVVVTVSMTVNYIKNTKPGNRMYVKSQVVHAGRSTMTIMSKLYDEENILLSEIMSSMMIVGHFEEIPRNW